MLALVDSWMQQAGPMALLAIALAAALEYVFPPFPGDTATLVGGFYAIRSGLFWGWVFLAVMTGSVLGSTLDYFAGRWAGRLSRTSPRVRGWVARIPPEAWEEKFRHRATLWLVVNRFLPGVRGPIFFAAGISGVPTFKVLALGTLSAFVWNAALFGAGALVGHNAEQVLGFLSKVGVGVWVVLGSLLILFLLHRWIAGGK